MVRTECFNVFIGRWPINKLNNKIFNLLLYKCKNIFKPKTLTKDFKLKFRAWATVGAYKSGDRLYGLCDIGQWNHNS